MFTDGWYGLFVRGDTRPEIQQQLSAHIGAAIKSEPYRKAMQDGGFEAAASTPQEAMQLVRTEYVRWARLVKSLNYTPE